MKANIPGPVFMLALLLLAVSCAPVLTTDSMQRGLINPDIQEIRDNPLFNKGKLFIMGGIIARTTVVQEGTLIEAVYVPVNSYGYLKTPGISNDRFLSIYRGSKILDPLIYREKREITVAGEFVEVRRGTVGEREYAFPFFNIREIYLWPEYTEAAPYPYPPRPMIYYRLRNHPYYDYPDYPYYPWWY